jgi:hypothetical protein
VANSWPEICRNFSGKVNGKAASIKGILQRGIIARNYRREL